MKKILVPCDFSNPSIQAFRFACDVASASKGEVLLLNIVELPTLSGSLLVPVQAYEKAFIKEVKNKINKNFEKLKSTWGGKVPVRLYVEQGSVVRTIEKFVSNKRVDLIVMGTHGSSGLRQYTIGSNTQKIVRASKVPVFTIRKANKISTLKNIIFVTDFNENQKNIIASIKTLQNFLKAQVHILYINTPANFTPDIITVKIMNEFAKQHQFRNYTLNIYNDISEENGIIDFSSQFKNRIIAMSTHGRKGLIHFLSGSIAEDVANQVDCPIWTLSDETNR